jgi:hypothetical protein
VPSFFVYGPWPSCYQRPRLFREVLKSGAQAVVRGGARGASQVLDRFVQADATGAKHLLDRGVQAVARGNARCALHVHGRGAKADACGRSFAVLSTQVSAVGLNLGHSRLACGSMLEVSRDAAAAEDK